MEIIVTGRQLKFSVCSQASKQVVLAELAVPGEHWMEEAYELRLEEIAAAHPPEPANAVESPEVTS